MSTKSTSRKKYTSEEKLNIVKMHLLGKRPVSSLCEEHGIAPSLFYKWQQQLFEQGSQVFDQAGKAGQERRESQENRRLREQLEKTEAKLANKHEVLSELMSEHIALKKSLGD